MANRNQASGARRGLLSLLLSIGSVAAADVVPFDATYEVRAHGLKLGEMHRRLNIEKSQYQFESTLEASGIAALLKAGREEEFSSGELVAGEFRPSRYRHRRIQGRKVHDTMTVFDWPRGQIETTARGQVTRIEAPVETLDKLVYQLMLSRDLIRSSQALNYTVADDGRIKSYHWQQVGIETLTIRGQQIPTAKVRYGRSNSERRTTLWCAPSFNYVPVKIEYRYDGSITTATLIKYQ